MGKDYSVTFSHSILLHCGERLLSDAVRKGFRVSFPHSKYASSPAALASLAHLPPSEPRPVRRAGLVPNLGAAPAKALKLATPTPAARRKAAAAQGKVATAGDAAAAQVDRRLGEGSNWWNCL